MWRRFGGRRTLAGKLPGSEARMDRQTVSSSNLASVGYEAPSETLEVEFKNGHIYQYYNVPQMMFDALMQAPSVGIFFNANIRNAFACAKI